MGGKPREGWFLFPTEIQNGTGVPKVLVQVADHQEWDV